MIEKENEMEHQTYIKTRYCESDAFGHINNVSYFIYLEQARVDFFIGTHIVETVEEWPFVAAAVHCDFIRQAKINQDLIVKTWVSKIGRSSVTINHVIMDQITEEVIARGEDVLVSFNMSEQKSEPLSDEMVAKLRDYVQG